jgi:mannitol-specific phosphotransferase system IIBC component
MVATRMIPEMIGALSLAGLVGYIMQRCDQAVREQPRRGDKND